MKALNTLLIIFIAGFSPNLFAKKAGEITAMQMPAWVKHFDGQTEPLKPGMTIQSGDQISTGSSSRLLIQLSEGSHLKLGENAQLNFNKLSAAKKTIKKEDRSFFEAIIRVAKGAFRFTTTAFGKNKQRDIKVRMGVITVDIRGTDIWGKSNNKKDLLALLEGNVTVQRDGEPEFTMQDSLSYYMVPKNKPAQRVQIIPQDQLAQWAAETELLDGVGVVTKKGKWNVNLMSVNNLKASAPIRKQFAGSGYATDIEKFISKGRTWYRIKIKGFKTREDANVFASIIDGLHGIRKPWVGK